MAVNLQDYDRLIKWGSCSWNYPVGWHGVVYHGNRRGPQLSLFADQLAKAEQSPATGRTTPLSPVNGCGAELLAEYCAYPRFSTLCFDLTHYRPFSRVELNEFARYLAPDFPVIIKVWDRITKIGHWKKMGSQAGKLAVRERVYNNDFLNPSLFVDEFLPPFQEAFAPHIGMFLFEFMRLGYYHHARQQWVNFSPRKFNQILNRFLGALPHEYRYAVEIRDRNLLTPEYARILRNHGVAHCFNQWESMSSIPHQYRIVGFTTDFSVARVLTPPKVKYAYVQKAYAPYDHIHQRLPQVRKDLMQLISEALRQNLELHIAINNRAEGNAPATVTELDESVRQLMKSQQGVFAK